MRNPSRLACELLCAIRRKPSGCSAKGATPIIGELGLPKTYVAAVKAADAVVHTALEILPRGIAKDKEALDIMLSAQTEASQADGKARVFIYTSSIWVLGRTVKPPKRCAARAAAVRPSGGRHMKSACCRRPLRRCAPWWSGPALSMAAGVASCPTSIKDALNGLIRVVGPGKNRWPCIYAHDLGVSTCASWNRRPQRASSTRPTKPTSA